MADTTTILSTEWNRKDLAIHVPGSYWDGDAGAWVTELTDGKTAAYALALFPEILVDYPELGERRDALYQSARPTDHATAFGRRLDWKGLEDVIPFEYQQLDTGYMAAQIQALGGAFLGWDRGLGKTMASMVIGQQVGAKRILVVCGNTMKETVWADEIRKRQPAATVRVLPNTKEKREAFIAEEATLSRSPAPGVTYTIVHYQALAIIAGEKGRGKGFDKLGLWDLMIFDEAHRLANTGTQMHRAARKVGDKSRFRLALTGTAIMNKGEDLFGQLNWVFPKTYPRKWKNWNNRYLEFIRTSYGMRCIGWKPEKIPQLRKELGIFMVYRTKDDELDLPGRTFETRLVDLKPKQRKAYDELRKNFWTIINGEEVYADNALSQLNLLRRVATGLTLEGGKVADSSKLDFAMELIEEQEDEAFVVFSWYRAPLDELGTRLGKAGIDYHLITGEHTYTAGTTLGGQAGLNARPQAVEAFQSGAGRVFLGTLSTLGESVNLQRASSAIFLDRAWNPATNAQAADRIYRIGQDRHVTVTDLVARDTVDELRVQPVLASKDALRRAVFG